MDAIIGRYRVRMEESGMVLGHASGINFDLTVEETIALHAFLTAYSQTLSVLQQDRECDTDPYMESIIISRKDKNS